MPNITIPPALAYPNDYVSFGNSGDCPPTARARSAPIYLDWSNVSAQLPAIAVDFSNRSDMPEQITSIYVDNGRSHQGVFILFPDTSFRIVVPAFSRGMYPVLTNTRRFIAGVFDSAIGTNDHTIIHALNWSPRPFEGDALIFPTVGITAFDPSVAQVNVPLFNNPGGTWLRMSELIVQLSGIVAGGAPGFQGLFELFADGVLVTQAGLHLIAAETVDANELVHNTNQSLAAIAWTFSWTIVAGTATTDGTDSGTVNLFLDVAEPN